MFNNEGSDLFANAFPNAVWISSTVRHSAPLANPSISANFSYFAEGNSEVGGTFLDGSSPRMSSNSSSSNPP